MVPEGVKVFLVAPHLAGPAGRVDSLTGLQFGGNKMHGARVSSLSLRGVIKNAALASAFRTTRRCAGRVGQLNMHCS